MIEYGLACLAVLCLTAWDRQAAPWAFLILCGWITGAGTYYYPEAWPVISLLLCGLTLRWFMQEPEAWKAGVHAMAVVMLSLDVWFFYNSLVLRNYVGVEYANALNVGLVAQLVLIGHRGAINAWTGVFAWGRDRLSGFPRHRSYGSAQKET